MKRIFAVFSVNYFLRLCSALPLLTHSLSKNAGPELLRTCDLTHPARESVLSQETGLRSLKSNSAILI